MDAEFYDKMRDRTYETYKELGVMISRVWKDESGDVRSHILDVSECKKALEERALGKLNLTEYTIYEH